MSRVIAIAAVLVAACAGCAHGPRAGTAATTGPATTGIISIGDTLVRVRAEMQTVGARDITSVVGMLRWTATAQSLWLWYELPDNTCVNIFVIGPTRQPEDLRVAEIEVGEIGKGYGGKLIWMDQKTSNRLRLNLLRPAETQPPPDSPTMRLPDT